MSADVTAKLNEVELKVTKARVGILEALQKADHPLDVTEIQSALDKKKIPADPATVYRILEIFHENRLVDRVEFQEGKFRYELSQNEHHHLICENCGTITDLQCPITDIEKTIAKDQKFQVKRHTLEFFGLCANCQ